MQARAWAACDERFEAYVGVPAAVSAFELAPSRASWEQGDTGAVCLLRPSDGAPHTGSAKASGS